MIKLRLLINSHNPLHGSNCSFAAVIDLNLYFKFTSKTTTLVRITPSSIILCCRCAGEKASFARINPLLQLPLRRSWCKEPIRNPHI
jgi:hypothetical protein